VLAPCGSVETTCADIVPNTDDDDFGWFGQGMWQSVLSAESLQPRVLGVLGMAWLRWRDASFKQYYPMARETWRGEVWYLMETRGLYVGVRGQVMRRKVEGHGCV
jgi:hypothetical protein